MNLLPKYNPCYETFWNFVPQQFALLWTYSVCNRMHILVYTLPDSCPLKIRLIFVILGLFTKTPKWKDYGSDAIPLCLLKNVLILHNCHLSFFFPVIPCGCVCLQGRPTTWHVAGWAYSVMCCGVGLQRNILWGRPTTWYVAGYAYKVICCGVGLQRNMLRVRRTTWYVAG